MSLEAPGKTMLYSPSCEFFARHSRIMLEHDQEDSFSAHFTCTHVVQIANVNCFNVLLIVRIFSTKPD